jgi:hypothetical protein
MCNAKRQLEWCKAHRHWTPEQWKCFLWSDEAVRLRARPNRPTSVPDLTNAFVAEWKQVPAAMFQHLVESLPRRVEAVIAAKRGPTPY